MLFHHHQQDPPSLTFARPEQIIKVSLGGSGVAAMSTFQEYHVRNKLFLISMENLVVKTYPFTLVLCGAFSFPFVLGD